MFCLDETYSTTEGYPGGSVPMQAMWVWSLRQEDLLEKEMANHSSILAWEIPGTEEPGELQSLGTERIGYD